MGINATIQNALFKKLNELVLSPALPVAWPNVDFTAPVGGKYLTVDLLPNTNLRLYQPNDSPHYRQGLLQVTVVAPLDSGTGYALGVADAIADHFPASLILYESGAKLGIQRTPDIAPPLRDDTTWRVPVTIRYELFY